MNQTRKSVTRQVITKKSDVITFGKYKGKQVSYIIDHEASYLLWLDENEIVEFPEDIMDIASHRAAEQHRDYMLEHYDYEYDNDDWGDRD